jgi:hypothetical protein
VLRQERGDVDDERQRLLLWVSMLKERTTFEKARVQAREWHLNTREELLKRKWVAINDLNTASQKILFDAKELYATAEARANTTIKQEEQLLFAFVRWPTGSKWWRSWSRGCRRGRGLTTSGLVVSLKPSPPASLASIAVRPPLRWGRRLWSPLAQGGGVRSRGTCGGLEALLRREAGSGAAGCMATPEPSRTGRLGPMLWGTRQCIVARPASHRSLELVCGVPGLQGTDNCLVPSPRNR